MEHFEFDIECYVYVHEHVLTFLFVTTTIYFSRVISPGAPFTQKLHIIYLVNDVLHHW
jgi:hypothetical protein